MADFSSHKTIQTFLKFHPHSEWKTGGISYRARILFSKLFDCLVWFCVTGIEIDYWEEIPDNPVEQGTVFTLCFKCEVCVHKRLIAHKKFSKSGPYLHF